jgi:hypothetical protein
VVTKDFTAYSPPIVELAVLRPMIFDGGISQVFLVGAQKLSTLQNLVDVPDGRRLAMLCVRFPTPLKVSFNYRG